MAVTSGENDDYPLEFGVPYFQTNPYELSQLQMEYPQLHVGYITYYSYKPQSNHCR